MANQNVDLRTKLNLTREQLTKDRQSFKELYRVEEAGPIEIFKANQGKQKKVENFIEHLYKAGMPKTSIRNMQTILEWNYEHPTPTTPPEYSEGTTTTTGAPNYPVSGNVAQGQREAQEAERQRREAATLASEEKGEQQTAEFLRQQKERAQRQKLIYDERIRKAEEARVKFEKTSATTNVKVTEEKAPDLSDKENTELQEFASEVKKDPVAATKIISKDIQARLQDLPPEAADLTAVTIVASIQNKNLPQIQTSVIESLKKTPEFSAWASPLADQSKTSVELAQLISQSAYGDVFQKTFLPKITTIISSTPNENYIPVSLGPMPMLGASLLNRQKAVLDKPTVEKPAFMRSWLDDQLALIKAGSIQGAEKNFSESLVQGYLVTYHPGPKIDWAATGGPAKLDIASGASEPFGLVSGVAKGVVQKAVTKGIGKALGTQVAVKATGAEIGAQLGALFGISGGPLAVVTTAIGAAAGWFIEKAGPTLKKYSAIVIGGLTALIALPIIGLGAALALGGGATVLSFALGAGAGGLTGAGLAAGITSFFGALASATLGAIGPPILFILLGFPVIVALILFIINSGAYVVPPSPLTNPFAGSGINVKCSDEKGPVGVPGPSSNSPIANRAWEISYDLYQGFWCFWNRSPKAPPQYFPNDVLKYPPGYPELFDYALFLRNPNPSESSGPDLFWCTWLPVKAYHENGNNIATELYVPNMYNDFKSRGKIIDAKTATPSNVVPGSVVFFQVTSGEFSNRLNHVGVVYSVDPGGIVVVESNNAIKSESINFIPGGGAGSLPGMLTKYFGLP